VLTEGHASHHRASRRGGAVAALTACLLAVAAPSAADATSLQQTRVDAARVMAQLDLLQTERSVAVQRQEAAGQRLDAARAALAASRRQIAAAESALARTQAALGETLVNSYKTRSESAVAYVLLAGSFADLLDRVDVLRRVASGDRELIDQITATTARLREERAVAARAAADAEKAAADAANARADIDRAIASRSQIVDGLNAHIADLLRQEQARRDTLATSNGSPAPSSGGSGGGGGGGSGRVFYGECTWYGPGFEGDPTASGELFDPNALTAASPWLPFGTRLHVTNLATGLSVDVRVNDRGPFGRGVLDLSARAARTIGLSGWQRVRIQILSGPRAARSVMP
jgi:rare lipoprotein A (peptidoglycan hydrolase)